MTMNNLRMSFALIILVCGSAVSQTQRDSGKVTMYRDLIRFAAGQEADQVRLEIRTSRGEKIFDSELVAGNSVDWFIRDEQGRLVSSGPYSYSLTTKDKTGTLASQEGNLVVETESDGLLDAPPLGVVRSPHQKGDGAHPYRRNI